MRRKIQETQDRWKKDLQVHDGYFQINKQIHILVYREVVGQNMLQMREGNKEK